MKKPARTCAALLMSVLLAACGGGGSSNTPLNVSAGVYSGTYNSNDWITVLTPNTSGAVNWYALNVIGDVPDIFSGYFSGLGSATMSSTGVNYFRSPNVRSGAGTITSPSTGQINQVLNFDPVGVSSAESFNATATKPAISSFNFDTPASLTALQGTWSGLLSYGNGSVTPYDIVFNGSGVLTTPTAVFNTDCQISSGTFSVYGGNVNLFNVQMHIPQSTVCVLSKDTQGGIDLAGVAYISSGPTRLRIIATMSNGKGLSFKADR